MIWTTCRFLPPASLWIIHVVLSLMSPLVYIFSDDVVTRFDIQHDSFRVSMSPATAIRMLNVFRFSYSSSTLAHHYPTHPSLPSAPLRSIRLHSTNQRFVPNFPDLQSTNPSNCFQIRMIDQSSTHFQISPTHSQTHSTRLPGSFVPRIMLNLDS